MIFQNVYQLRGSFIFLSLCFFSTILSKVMFDFKSGIIFTILLVHLVDLHAYLKREFVYIVYNIMKLFTVLHDCRKNIYKLINFNWNITCTYLEYAMYFNFIQIVILMPFIMFSIYVRCLILYKIINSLYAGSFTCTNSCAKLFTMFTRVLMLLICNSKTFIEYEYFDRLEKQNYQDVKFLHRNCELCRFV